MLVAVAFAGLIAAVSGHGAMVSPLSRNAVDSLVGVNTQRCSNITGDKCNNGQGSAKSGSGQTKMYPDYLFLNNISDN